MLPTAKGYELGGKTDHGPITADPARDRAAGITVCARASDADDARQMLDALGLLP